MATDPLFEVDRETQHVLRIESPRLRDLAPRRGSNAWMWYLVGVLTLAAIALLVVNSENFSKSDLNQRVRCAGWEVAIERIQKAWYWPGGEELPYDQTKLAIHEDLPGLPKRYRVEGVFIGNNALGVKTRYDWTVELYERGSALVPWQLQIGYVPPVMLDEAFARRIDQVKHDIANN